MNLVIVESPAKAKTIQKYLGPEFEVAASYGHVRDLIPKNGAVNPANGFAMQYQVIERNDRYVQAIGKKLKTAQSLYLATDPDREGEAIAWHLCEILKERGELTKQPVQRVVFHEITQRAVTEALAKPRAIAIELVNAQQARRALDYLVGFNLSPLLWKKIRRGLSAGRVQSPALRLICERTAEINAFVSREYWTLEADVSKEQKFFSARLTILQNERIELFSIPDETHALRARRILEQGAQGKLTVQEIERKQRKRHPAPPFTTSTLQQEAARKLGFTTKRTMKIAQQLYEGIKVKQENVGLITYMRTDSVNLAGEAISEMREYIKNRYGAEAVPEVPRQFKTKSKNAQEAHEAIRPTVIQRDPEILKPDLTDEQLKLYELIWRRTVACQMTSALINQVAIDFSAGAGNRLRANGSVIAEPGFMRVYLEGRDDAQGADDDEENLLPELTIGEQVILKQIRAEQHFTEPPPRYSEASLVKALENLGIGRPSTYATIISTIQEREYAILDNKRFIPTDVGQIVNRFLTEHFAAYIDYDFTARLEDELDEIARGEADWIPLLDRFWDPFKNQIDHIGKNIKRREVTQERLNEHCPTCDGDLIIRLGRSKRFIGCVNYPKCTYTRDLNPDQPSVAVPAEIAADRTCPLCQAPLLIKTSRYGKFLGCSNYPRCKHIEALFKPQTLDIICPQCKLGTLQKRKSRTGKIFHACSTYPKCDYALWGEPIAETCPQCNWPILTIKITKTKGTHHICPQKECGYRALVIQTPPENNI